LDNPEPHLIRRNFNLGVVNGALFYLSLALMSPTIILSVFAYQLTGSNKMVGVINSLTMLGWLWPQLFFANIIEAAERKKPFYVVSAILRSVTLGTIPVLLLVFGTGRPLLLFWSVAFLLLAHSSIGALGYLPFMDIVTRSMPANMRGRFFGARAFWGGILGLLGSIAARYILSEKSGLAFPTNYVLIFFLAFVFSSIAVTAFCMVHEPPSTPQKRRISLGHQLRRGPRLLTRDKVFRRFFLVRVLLALTGMAPPFFIIYAKQEFHVPAEAAAVFLAVQIVFSSFSAPIWGKIGDRWGNKVLLIWCGIIAALSMALILVSGRIIPILGRAVPSPETVFFGIIFACYGLGYAGTLLGGINYLLDIAPPRRRSTYVAFMNAFTTPLTFAPVLGGFLVDIFSFRFVFALSAFLAIGGTIASRSLRDPRR